MRWFKVAAILVGVMIAFLIISSVVGFLVEGLIAALAVAAVVLAVRAASNRRKQISSKTPSGEIPRSRYSGPRRRRSTAGVDDELARLKRETGG